jgi:hypothetical protein
MKYIFSDLTDVSEECIASNVRVKKSANYERRSEFLALLLVGNVLQLLVTANVVSSSLIYFTPLMQAIISS